MSGHDELEEAGARLLAALDELETTIERRFRDDRDVRELDAQLRALVGEREQLYARLEAERRRADRLESTNEEVSERLGSVIDSVRGILQTN